VAHFIVEMMGVSMGDYLKMADRQRIQTLLLGRFYGTLVTRRPSFIPGVADLLWNTQLKIGGEEIRGLRKMVAEE